MKIDTFVDKHITNRDIQCSFKFLTVFDTFSDRTPFLMNCARHTDSPGGGQDAIVGRLGSVLQHVCKLLRLWILYDFIKNTCFTGIHIDSKSGICILTLVSIAKVASPEVRPRRVGEGFGAAHVDEYVAQTRICISYFYTRN